MARLYLFSEPGVMLNMLYTVDQAVGRGCPNQRDDVALVQFFVRRVLEGWNDLPPGLPLLSIDGNFAEPTRKYVEYWQKGENKRNTATDWRHYEDGVVSPIADRSGMRGNNVYTMVTLNTNYSDRYGKVWHSNIAVDSVCPVALLPSIFWR
jgi:hypothetical protein